MTIVLTNTIVLTSLPRFPSATAGPRARSAQARAAAHSLTRGGGGAGRRECWGANKETGRPRTRCPSRAGSVGGACTASSTRASRPLACAFSRSTAALLPPPLLLLPSLPPPSPPLPLSPSSPLLLFLLSLLPLLLFLLSLLPLLLFLLSLLPLLCAPPSSHPAPPCPPRAAPRGRVRRRAGGAHAGGAARSCGATSARRAGAGRATGPSAGPSGPTTRRSAPR